LFNNSCVYTLEVKGKRIKGDMINNKAIVRSFINAKLKRKHQASLCEIEKDIVNILLLESEKIEREYSNIFETFSSLVADLPPDEEYLPTILKHLL